MRADAREGDGLCLQPSTTAIGSTAYGYRLQPRQDFPGLVGCVLRCRCLRRRGAGGAMATDGTRSTRTGPKPPLTGAALRKAIMALWCVAFCGMQRRAIGQLCDIPFGTLYTLFAPGLACGAACSTA